MVGDHNKMRVFHEEIFGLSVSVATFKTDEEALSIANDTLSGLRDGIRAYRMGRAIQAGGVWTSATTPIRRMRRSVATSAPALGARRTA